MHLRASFDMQINGIQSAHPLMTFGRQLYNRFIKNSFYYKPRFSSMIFYGSAELLPYARPDKQFYITLSVWSEVILQDFFGINAEKFSSSGIAFRCRSSLFTASLKTLLRLDRILTKVQSFAGILRRSIRTFLL